MPHVKVFCCVPFFFCLTCPVSRFLLLHHFVLFSKDDRLLGSPVTLDCVSVSKWHRCQNPCLCISSWHVRNHQLVCYSVLFLSPVIKQMLLVTNNGCDLCLIWTVGYLKAEWCRRSAPTVQISLTMSVWLKPLQDWNYNTSPCRNGRLFFFHFCFFCWFFSLSSSLGIHWLKWKAIVSDSPVCDHRKTTNPYF